MANDKKFIVKNGLTANTINLVDDVVNPANTINIAMDGANDKLVISGDAGDLLTVTDANTGTLFEVANSSGITIFSVEDDGTVTGVPDAYGQWNLFTNGTFNYNITANASLDIVGSGGVDVTFLEGALTISHTDTSTLSGTYGSTSGGTKIDQITVDDKGHVTSITTGATGSGTMSSFNIQSNSGTQVAISNGEEINFINGNATTAVVVNQANPTVTFNHADTSSQTSVNNSGRTYIQDITLDTYGHITGITSATETVVNTDTNTTYSISAVDSGSNAIIRLTAGGSGSGTDDVTLVAGSNVTLTPSGDNITIAATDTNTTSLPVKNSAGVLQLLATDTSGIRFAGSGATTVAFDDGTATVTISSTDTSYDGWELYTQDTPRGTIASGEAIDFQGGSTVTLAYSTFTNGNRITFNVTDNSIGAGQLNVSGNGTAGQALLSDGDGSFSWGEAGSSVTVSATAPSSPSEGELWWDEDVGNMFIYYNDGTSSQWVEASPNPKSLVYNAGTSTYTLTGNLTVTGDLNSNSDEKLKDNINTIEGGLEAVKALRGVRYDWKENGKSSIGLIAQEVEKVLPELVSEQDDIKSIQYGNIVAVLIEAVKELSAKVEELENK